MIFKKLTSVGLIAALMTSVAIASDSDKPRPEKLAPYSERPITDEIMYFVLPDRFENGDTSNDLGGLEGDRLVHGFDPTDTGFYHGGDLKGLIGRLDYLADMGISSIWLTPIFKNQPVQIKDGGKDISAGYHGYWITDFTRIDPHLGSNDDLKALVSEAHKRNMKVFFDIIANHTADNIRYIECHGPEATVDPCVYRDFDEVPYTPYYPEGMESAMVPAWLNNPGLYTNRGESHWEGASAVWGDFAGLDDLNTRHPEVVSGMIDIYKHWISEFRIDGYRVDTVKHVNDEFWLEFNKAIMDHAKAEGIDNFFMFGEVYDFTPEFLSHYTRDLGMPGILDFATQQKFQHVLTGEAAPATLVEHFGKDDLYKTEDYDAGDLPTFLGNHDMGRIGYFLQKADPDMSEKEALKRMLLGHAMLYYTRGVPVVYYGDEQGFTGDGNDRAARENMFPSVVDSYNDNRLIGTDATTAISNFDTEHPIYRMLSGFAAARLSHPALRGGDMKIIHAADKPGIFAVERTNGDDRVIAIFNSSDSQVQASFTLADLDKKPCLVDGVKGIFARKEEAAVYVAPALSWAVYTPGKCEH